MTLTERIDPHAYAIEAREVDPRRAAATVIAAPCYAIGWALAFIWYGIVWCCIAGRAGYRDARARFSGPAPATGRPPEAPVRPMPGTN